MHIFHNFYINQTNWFYPILISSLLYIICLLIFNFYLMEIFAQITKKCQQPPAAQLIQTLNQFRISLNHDFISQS